MKRASEWSCGEFTISTDKSRLDVALIREFLATQSYWARGIPIETVRRSIEHALCFGVYAADGRQAGFARVVTDHCTFAWLSDVFVLPEFRGRGISKRLMEVIVAHPDLQGLRRVLLATNDAHGLYAQFGFNPPANPERFLERYEPDPYRPGPG